jgi:hypothetical protein
MECEYLVIGLFAADSIAAVSDTDFGIDRD